MKKIGVREKQVTINDIKWGLGVKNQYGSLRQKDFTV